MFPFVVHFKNIFFQKWSDWRTFPYSHYIAYFLYYSIWMSDIWKLYFPNFPSLLCPSPLLYSKILFFFIPLQIRMDVSMIFSYSDTCYIHWFVQCSVQNSLFIRQDSNTTVLESLTYHRSVSDNGVHERYFVACLAIIDSAHFFLPFWPFSFFVCSCWLRKLESFGPIFCV